MDLFYVYSKGIQVHYLFACQSLVILPNTDRYNPPMPMTIHIITAAERSMRQLQHVPALHARSSYIKRKLGATKQSKEQIKDVKGIFHAPLGPLDHHTSTIPMSVSMTSSMPLIPNQTEAAFMLRQPAAAYAPGGR